MNYIVSFNNITEKEIYLAGGKGSSLAKLVKAGLPVPPGFIILPNAFYNNTLREDFKNILESFISKLSDKITYAVRSSAIGEDSKNASFAGAYETMLDVKRIDIASAVDKIALSAKADRVTEYAKNRDAECGGIAVVVQQFVKPEYAGVLFTSNPITGNSTKMIGNYVKGVGESLVSGSSNAIEFSFDAMNYSFKGDDKIKPYAKKLFRYAVKIQKLYGCPQDIEWAVSNGKVYILQSRPITTLRRCNTDTYEINGSLGGEYLFTKTNVGEIFMHPVSPATYGILESIFDMIGIHYFVENIYGQLYCNISVICSLLVSFGVSKKKAYSLISDIAGNLPDDIEIPLFQFNKIYFIKKIATLIFSKKSKSNLKMSNKEFSNNISNIADELIKKIHTINENNELYDFWVNECDAFMTKVMNTIISSVSVKQLFNTRNHIIKIAGETLANELCSNCSSNGILESMKPLLGIEDIISGKITKEEYVKKYGHRSPDEMELSCPYPYENPDFPFNRIEEHEKSGINAYKLKSEQEKRYEKAVAEFKTMYPNKSEWLDKTLSNFSKAVYTRENVRSQSVKLFCLMREYLLRASKLNNLGDDIFMLYFTETMQLLKGNTSVIKNIPTRRQNYEYYLKLPKFPNIIVGRFEPKQWLADENRRTDFYLFGKNITDNSNKNYTVKGYAGASGVVVGVARVLNDLSQSEQLKQGEILVTTATNIGWTPIFTKVSAIVTDIGAPLSHAAIVAREFGIPAVVGCGNATQEIKTGDIIRVDGINGTVIKI
ncbi:MAG: PEP/pyruvate-binding domain-containing protein [Bacillota bacterium]|nr:PEP/pyruvate-binding domain-containing protein [Bacillota bacterium]